MQTSTYPIRVLCFGDSNTWGYNPLNGSRHPVDQRWPGKLQQLLGTNFLIIEEGLNGRTTAFDDTYFQGRNGLTVIGRLMDKNEPIDIAIVCLGANDTKPEFNVTPEQITQGLEKVIQIIIQKGVKHLVIASPIWIDSSVMPWHREFVEVSKKSQKLAPLFKNLADKYNATSIDLSKVAKAGRDGCHMDAANHILIAEHLHDVVSTLK